MCSKCKKRLPHSEFAKRQLTKLAKARNGKKIGKIFCIACSASKANPKQKSTESKPKGTLSVKQRRMSITPKHNQKMKHPRIARRLRRGSININFEESKTIQKHPQSSLSKFMSSKNVIFELLLALSRSIYKIVNSVCSCDLNCSFLHPSCGGTSSPPTKLWR